jgi:hypothetical protein
MSQMHPVLIFTSSVGGEVLTEVSAKSSVSRQRPVCTEHYIPEERIILHNILLERNRV